VRNLVVWDPNPFNPYGAEVARVLEGSARFERVVRYCRPSTSFDMDGVRNLAKIPNAAEGNRTAIHSLKYGLALLRFAAHAVFGRRIVVVVCWVSNPLEASVLLAISRLRAARIVLVVHNPVEGRDDAKHGTVRRALRNRADRLVVHTQDLQLSLANQGEANTSMIAVARHPSYSIWSESMQRSFPVVRTTPRPVAVFLGSARDDKGFDLLPPLSEELARYGLELHLAVGILSPRQRALVADSRNIWLVGDGASYLSDEKLYVSLASSSVVVAPYMNVTASGSIILAKTMGVPIVDFQDEFGGAGGFATASVSLRDIEGMARVASSIARSPSPETGWSERHDDLARKEWGDAVADL
jgi:hypothetical protein